MANNEYEQRRQAVAEGLAGRKLDALLVSFSPNLRYLSGFTGSSGALLILPGKSILLTDPRYQIQAPQESTCQVRIVKGPLVIGLLAAVKKLGVKRIGYEPARMTCDFFDAVKSQLSLRASLEPVHGWIEELRMVKSADELELIRRSVDTNSRAFEQTIARIKPGIKEQDLAAELEYRMRRLGAEKPAFETIVATGVRSALPHAQPTGARLTAGDLVVVDMGAFQGGYASDMTRMLSVGPPNAKVKRMYRAVLEAQLAAIDAVRAGAKTARIDSAARKVLKGHGLDKVFIHSTGHGLGLEIHEPPRLGKHDKARLRAGMAITIEPGAYVEGFGGVRIEDTVIVTEKGCEILTPTSKDLYIV
ncbi:MAG: peptidase [Candidatus Solibacter sp.]|jgi:Xaa-Pro aminopeptidase|nr:peptidase [Candidatus Solibacter sp.]